MTCDQSKRSIASVVVMIGLGGFACAHSSSAPAPATAASAEPSGNPSETTTPPSSANSAGAAASASAAPAEAPPQTEKAEEEDEAANDLMEHHRHHHRGGVTRFIAMSLDTLGIAPDQRAAVEKIHAELRTSLTPARDADAKLLKVLADGVAAGSIDKAKAAAAVSRVEATSGAAQGASLDALNKLHAVLTPEQRTALVEKVRAHWEVWQQANVASADAGEGAKHPHLEALSHELGLTPEQVDKIKTALAAEKGGKHFDRDKVEAHVKAFETAFASDKFDAKALSSGKEVNAHLSGWGAERLAHFVEVVTPVLTPEQRTKFGEQLKEHASHKDEDVSGGSQP
jgi:Spy/CpxP family protein refolding chaperone